MQILDVSLPMGYRVRGEDREMMSNGDRNGVTKTERCVMQSVKKLCKEISESVEGVLGVGINNDYEGGEGEQKMQRTGVVCV